MHASGRRISHHESWLVFLFAFVILILFLISFFYDVFVPFHPSTPAIRLAVDDPRPPVPGGFHFLIVPICLALIRPRRYILATIFTGVLAAFLLLSCYIRLDRRSFLGGTIPGDPGLVGELYLKFWFYDYLALLSAVVLLPWLLSILYRVNAPE